MGFFTIVGAIMGLGLMIVVHEAGHFVVARMCGMRVERFSIGFGPGVLRWRSKGGTLFQLAPIPFGGFVEIKGMAIAEDVDPDDHAAYPNRPVWQRIATIFAGPATNYLTAVVLAFILFTCAGIPREQPTFYGVSTVAEGFDSATKLKPGDRILAINDTPLFVRDAQGKRSELCVATSKTVNGIAIVDIVRDGKPMRVEVKTKLDLPEAEKDGKYPDSVPKECRGKRWMLGITHEEQRDRVDVGIVHSAGHAIAYPVHETISYFTGIYQAIKGKEKLTLTGPVGMGKTIKRAIEAGWITAIRLLMLLNVLLAIMNLFPLPGLDGGRLAFLGYELVTRRRANPKVETTVHMVGILILMVILVMVTVKECRSLF